MPNSHRPRQEDRRRRGWADEDPLKDEDACADLASECVEFAAECGEAIWLMKGLAESESGRAPLADTEKPEHIITYDVLNICSAMAQTGNVPGGLVGLCHQILAKLDPNRFHPEKVGNAIFEAAFAKMLRESISGSVSRPIALELLIAHDKRHGGSRAKRAASIYHVLVLQAFNFYLPFTLDDPAWVAAAGGIANGFLKLLTTSLDGKAEAPNTSDAQPGENGLGEQPHSCSECLKAYQLLELPYGAPLDKVQQARRELATSLHPDKWLQKRGAHFAEEQLKRINSACDHVIECRAGSAKDTRHQYPPSDRTKNQDQSRVKTEVAAGVWSSPTSTSHHASTPELPISSKTSGAAWWVMGGLVVLLSMVVGLLFFLVSIHNEAPDVARSQQPKRHPSAPVPASAPMDRKDLWRPARAAKHLLIWDFRNVRYAKRVTDTETLQQLRDAIAPTVTGHTEQTFFYGPVIGNFIGERLDSHQELYTAVLSWVAAGRSHADGDLVLAIVLGSSGSQVFELDGGGVAIGTLRLPGAVQDLVISTPEWSGQGETSNGLSIFAISNERAEKVAGISTVYVDDCASGSSQALVVADRIYADVDATGHFSFGKKEHWTSLCPPGTPLTLASKGPESAEDVYVRILKTADSVQ